MTTHTDNAVNEFAYSAGTSYDQALKGFEPELDFLFDLEGKLYELEGLSTSLESVLIDVIHKMRPHDRGRAAAIDYAVTELRQKIHDLACEYEAVGARPVPPCDVANSQVEPAGERQRDDRGRFLKRAA